MKLLSLLIILNVLPTALPAQMLHGIIFNAEDNRPLANVSIKNLSINGNVSVSDLDGHYQIFVQKGDSLELSLLGFASQVIVYTGNNKGSFSWVSLNPQRLLIDTVTISSLTKYQKDSIERRAIYGKAVDYNPAKVEYHPLVNPFVIKAPISGLIEKHIKRYKRLKRFQDRFHKQEEQSFIDTRYNPDSVIALTGISHDSVYRFMNAYPIAYDFARAASDLEIKMWIKYNYRLWMNKEKKY